MDSPPTGASLRALVLDAGSHCIKAGYGTATAPESFPSLAGQIKYKRIPHGCLDTAPMSVGRDVTDRRGLLRLSYPIQHGAIVDWAAWHMLLGHVEERLAAPIADTHVFWIEHPFSSRPQRARVAEVLFEEKQAAGMCVGTAPLLSLYATGHTTGVVLDVGDGVSSVAAAVQGYAIPAMMQREDFGGGAVTHYLQRLLREYGSYSTCTAPSGPGTGRCSPQQQQQWGHRAFDPSRCGSERELVRQMKEQRCALSPTPAPTGTDALCPTDRSYSSRMDSNHSNSNHNSNGEESHPNSGNGSSGRRNGSGGAAAYLDLSRAVCTAEAQRHRLPDGTELLLGHELTQAPEVLFRPALLGKEHRGIAALVADAIRAADVELRAGLCEHVCLTGGATLMGGFGRRFLAELLRLTPRDCKVRVTAPAERAYTAWLGAALLSQVSTFSEQLVVRRAEFMEEGERALHTRRLG